MAPAVAISDDDAAVVAVGQALEVSGDEELYSFWRVGRICEDEVGASDRRGRKAEAQIALEASDAETQRRSLTVNEFQRGLVDVDHHNADTRIDLPQRQGGQIVIADAEQDQARHAARAVEPQCPPDDPLSRDPDMIAVQRRVARLGDPCNQAYQKTGRVTQ